MRKEADVQNMMQTKVRHHTYDMPASKLKTSIEDILKSGFNTGWTFTNETPEMAKRNQRIIEAIKDEGFIYNQKFYSPMELEIGIMDMIKGTDHMKDKIVRSTKEQPYHVISETEKGFKIVFENSIITGTNVGKNKSKLSVQKITALERDPLQLKMNWMGAVSNIFGKGGSWLSIERGPIVMEKTMENTQRNATYEVTFFKKIDADKAKSMEDKIRKML